MMTPTDMPKREFGVLSRDIILNGKVLERGEDASLRSLLSMGKPANLREFRRASEIIRLRSLFGCRGSCVYVS